MIDHSNYMDKSAIPADEDLKKDLLATFRIWQLIKELVLEKYPAATQEWNFPGKKYGWSYRMKDKKRAIIYFLPRKEYFMVAFVFGDKATAKIMDSAVSSDIKERLSIAKKYAEGRGIRIEIRDESLVKDIETLIEIKLGN